MTDPDDIPTIGGDGDMDDVYARTFCPQGFDVIAMTARRTQGTHRRWIINATVDTPLGKFTIAASGRTFHDAVVTLEQIIYARWLEADA